MKKRFSEEQIIGILKEAEAGMKVAEVCRKHGIAEATYYNWKAKYGGMEASDIKRMKQLEEENRRLKAALADSVVANHMLETLINVANMEYKTDLKKNFGNGVSPKGPKK